MADAAPITGAPLRASNILPFRTLRKGPAYAPGVRPFDPMNPDHVAAWNAVWSMAIAERNAREGR